VGYSPAVPAVVGVEAPSDELLAGAGDDDVDTTPSPPDVRESVL
jgi:hypothetical protein